MFIIYTIIFLAANIGMGKFLMLAIADGGFIDVLFGYQKKLNKLYGKGAMLDLLEKFLGGCGSCFLHFVSLINFTFYALFMNVVFDNWISDGVDNVVGKVLVNIIWYVVYVSLGWFLSDTINNKK